MNDIHDTKLLAVLKVCAKAGDSPLGLERAQTKLEEAIREFGHATYGTHARSIAKYLTRKKRMEQIGTPEPFPLDEVLGLCRVGFSKSAEFIMLTDDGETIIEQIDRVLEVAPTTKVLDALAKRSSTLLCRTGEILRTATSLSGREVMLNWYFQKGHLSDFRPLLPRLLVELESIEPNQHILQALALVLVRDKEGEYWQLVLLASECNEVLTEHLLSLMLSNSKLAENLLTIFPKLLSKPESGHALILLERALPQLLETKARTGSLCGQFAILVGTTLKSDKPNSAERRLLEIANGLVLSTASRTSSFDLDRVWLTGSARAIQQSTPNDADLSSHGAKLLVESIEKANRGASIQGLLEALALNLAMTKQDAVGGIVLFDPEFHEDTEGGLLRGDKAIVLTSGWRLRGRIVGRALVKKHGDESSI